MHSLVLACLHMGQEVVSDLSEGQLAGPEFTESRKLRGLCTDVSFLSGGSRLAVCAQPKNSLCLSCVYPISLNNGFAEQVMK